MLHLYSLIKFYINVRFLYGNIALLPRKFVYVSSLLFLFLFTICGLLKYYGESY